MFSSPGGKSAADAHFEFRIEFVFSIKGADQLLRIQHFKTLIRLNVAGSDLAFLVYDKRQFLGLVVLTIQFEFHFLEIQDDVGQVLNHAGQCGELVLRAGDFYRGYGRAFERGKQTRRREFPTV